MTEQGEGWRRFVAVDTVVTVITAVLFWGIYLYFLKELSDYMLLGAIIMFIIDICGLFGILLAAVLLLIGWRTRKSGVVQLVLSGEIRGRIFYAGNACGYVDAGDGACRAVFLYKHAERGQITSAVFYRVEPYSVNNVKIFLSNI